MSATRAGNLAELHRQRPRRLFVTWSLRIFLGIIATSWLAGDFQIGGWLTPARSANLNRFLAEIRPWPLQGQTWDWATAWDWTRGMWSAHGAEAVAATFALSLVAMVLAGLWGAVLSLPAARNFACPRPFLTGGRPPSSGSNLAWSLLVALARTCLVFIRSVPEYVWAFLLLALMGPGFWPLILALAIHNTGILGKLGAEVVENSDQTAPAALRALGATRYQIVVAGLFPLTLPRFLLYFFYRWETCVREATVLGMLGISSLGFWMVDSRARNRYDELMFYILAGVLLVLLGDFISALVRRLVRRA
jgi:phosphonate transport system permease protein